MECVLGIDVGTTGVKAALVAPDGRVLAAVDTGYPLHHPQVGWAEQAPGDWWQATMAAVPAVLARVPGASVCAVGISGQMHGAVLLDDAGVPVRPCIIWSDQRTQAECDEITATVGEATLAAWVANPALPGFTAPKLLWVRRHEPVAWNRVRTLLLPKDFVRFHLTGALATDESDAAGTLLYDVAGRQWSAAMTAALGLAPSLLPRCVESTAVMGQVTATAAAATGLPAGIPVVGGGADNACAAVGSGVVAPGDLLVSVGTSGTVVAPLASPAVDPGGRLHTFNHAVPGRWYLMGVMQAAGLSLRWLRDLVDPEAIDGYDALASAAAQTPAGAEGLLWLPYLQGERTPHRDPDARGVLFGVTPRHGCGHVARAVMEGVAFGLRDSVALLRAAGVPAERAVITGGGAASPVWRQIISDVIGLPLRLAQDQAGPAFGAALLAAIALGWHSSVEAAAAAMVRTTGETAPNLSLRGRYDDLFGVYQSLYSRP
ncbi:MAG: xylulokinase [Chloroflexi bacterium]|nr:xylulokinase [Chloroflexota bacterium]